MFSKNIELIELMYNIAELSVTLKIKRLKLLSLTQNLPMSSSSSRPSASTIDLTFITQRLNQLGAVNIPGMQCVPRRPECLQIFS